MDLIQELRLSITDSEEDQKRYIEGAVQRFGVDPEDWDEDTDGSSTTNFSSVD